MLDALCLTVSNVRLEGCCDAEDFAGSSRLPLPPDSREVPSLMTLSLMRTYTCNGIVHEIYHVREVYAVLREITTRMPK